MKTVSWKDGKGSQEEHVSAVSLWAAFHDKLRGSDLTKITAAFSVIMFQSQLYGYAQDLVKMVCSIDVQFSIEVHAIVRAVYNRGGLSTVRDLYHDFMTLMSLKRGPIKMIQSPESLFEAQVVKFNAHSTCLLCV